MRSASTTPILSSASPTQSTSTAPRPAKVEKSVAKLSDEQHVDHHATDFDHHTFKVTADKRVSYVDPIVLDHVAPTDSTTSP